VRFLPNNTEWIIPPFVYFLSLIIKWFIYLRREGYEDNLKIMGIDFALMGFALLLALLFKSNSQIIADYPDSHEAIVWMMIFLYTLASALITGLLNVHFHSNIEIFRHISLFISYILGYVLFISPIRML
jgi:hypothetical protein